MEASDSDDESHAGYHKALGTAAVTHREME
jgi:hypothetical protein